jgi:hypothetical protein
MSERLHKKMISLGISYDCVPEVLLNILEKEEAEILALERELKIAVYGLEVAVNALEELKESIGEAGFEYCHGLGKPLKIASESLSKLKVGKE